MQSLALDGMLAWFAVVLEPEQRRQCQYKYSNRKKIRWEAGALYTMRIAARRRMGCFGAVWPNRLTTVLLLRLAEANLRLAIIIRTCYAQRHSTCYRTQFDDTELSELN